MILNSFFIFIQSQGSSRYTPDHVHPEYFVELLNKLEVGPSNRSFSQPDSETHTCTLFIFSLFIYYKDFFDSLVCLI